MDLQAASWMFILAPTFVAAAVVCVLPGLMPMNRPWARAAVTALVWAFTLRYLHWRLTDTLVLERGWIAAAWSIFCASIEVAALADAAFLYLAFLRTTDRGQEADAREARLRDRLKGAPAPRVDVYIPTYNEPAAVLEKTIVGAISLEWPNLAVYVLDDGRRPWVKALCEDKGVGYITRPDNAGAKAGNINHALKHTDGEFLAVFDADFVAQRAFLMRAIGFFEEARVGIVQIPHAFYNHDPMQTNLAMRKSLPDDQRFFFERIMPSRDGWDAAFCCGSNSVTRRAALQAVGDKLPDGSITEDMLLSLVMLRRGFVTRYLNEPLAYGLAPESVSAFFVQRQRWARGATQMLFLKEGPLGPGLRLAHRLLFLPTHWLTQGLMTLMSLIAPLAFMLFDLPPMTHTSLETAVFYVLPMLIAVIGGFTTFGRGMYHPLAAQVLGIFQSFKLAPTVLATLVRPHGHVFKVTPKGADATLAYERGTFLACAVIIALTLIGLTVNLSPEWRRVEDGSLLPLVAMWSVVNLVVLFLVSLLCLQTPIRRQEERFKLAEPVLVRQPAGGALVTLMSEDISLSGVGLRVADADHAEALAPGDEVEAYVSQVGWVKARVARRSASLIGLQFAPEGLQADLLIRKVFTDGRNTETIQASTLEVTLGLLTRIFTADMRASAAPPAESAPAPPPEPQLARETLVIRPTRRTRRLAEAVSALQKAA